ncbi:MAG: hypothetical protein M1354_01020 [Candidatus Marsarchaeota archaeon]|nr:hypothetical protein [Candidatus Marsarchaeota archaeon]
MKEKQEQLTIERQINAKLDRITIMLDELLKKAENEDKDLDRRLAKKIAKEWKEIEKGRVKIHHYNSLKDFEKAIG